jgi:hypothetical protein
MFAVGDRLLSSPFHDGNLFTLLHVSVCAELLKALQKEKSVCESQWDKKNSSITVKTAGGLILGSCTALWSILNHHMLQKPIRRPQLDKTTAMKSMDTT